MPSHSGTWRAWTLVTLLTLLALSLGPGLTPAVDARVNGQPAPASEGTRAGQGKLLAWGSNQNGRVGDGSGVNQPLPVALPLPANVVAISSGIFHTLAVTADGRVWAWGDNEIGEIGLGTVTTTVATPTQLPDFAAPARIISVAAGFGFSLALDSDGTVWSWGNNFDGELGDGTTTNRSSPFPNPTLTDIIAIAAGEFHSLALASDGTVWTWGKNNFGQAGDGSIFSSSPACRCNVTPVHLTNFAAPARITALAAAAGHSVALASDGTVWAWGFNQEGEVGDGTVVTTGCRCRPNPNHATGLGGIVAVSASSARSLALAADGTLWTWGRNTDGLLGDGTATDRPAAIHLNGPGTPTDIVAISVGGIHSMALAADGTVWAWGTNFAGEVGDGTTTPVPTPLHLTGASAPANVAIIAAGGNVSFAVQSVSNVAAWGAGTQGQLGLLPVANRSRPTFLANPPRLVAISGGGFHSLGLDADGTVWAWGSGVSGQLGLGNTVSFAQPVHLPNFAAPARIVAISAANGHFSFALASDGTLWGWGSNINGQLGLGTASSGGCFCITTPQHLVGAGMPTNIIAVATGASQTIALAADGTVWTWGGNFDGQIGDGTVDFSSPPNCACVPTPQHLAAPTGIVAVEAGGQTDYALAGDGTIWAWGANFDGEIGDGTRTTAGCGCKPSPTHLAAPTGIVAIAGGAFHALALAADGTIWSWGMNILGSLGTGAITNTGCSCLPAPQHLTTPTGIVSISADGFDSLALANDGTLWSWGYNGDGQTGDGTTGGGTCNCTPAPQHLAAPVNVSAIAAGASHTLALVGEQPTSTALGGPFTATYSAPNVALTAGVTSVGTPVNGGSVGFAVTDGGNVAVPGSPASGTVANGSATGTLPLGTAIGAGTYTVAGTYTPVAPYLASAAAATTTLTVNKANTALTFASGNGPFGGGATLTATLRRTNGDNGPVVGATVAFQLNGTPVGTGVTDGSGVAVLPNVSLTGINSGTYATAVKASFTGDANHNAAADATGPLTVGKVPTAVTNVSGTARYRGQMILTATVTQTGGGPVAGVMVVFTVRNVVQCSTGGGPNTCPLTNAQGVATLTIGMNLIAPGTFPGLVGATFAGNANFLPSGGTGNLVVTP